MRDDGTWRTRSLWLSGVEADPIEPLDTTTRADVVIAGGGYTGLWTAIFLKEADPSLEVVLLEQEVAGYGGSGRNAGFCMTLLDFSLHHLVRNHGVERAGAAHRAVADSVDAIGAFAAAEGFDPRYERTGYLQVATNPAQERRLRRDLEAAERLGLEGWRWLDRAAARERIDSPRIGAGLFEDACAVLDPARLAVGLRRAARRRGVRVCEATPVTAFRADASEVRFRTPTGDVQAACGVLALNPWMVSFPSFARQTVPIYTSIIASEPLTDEQRGRIGWTGREGLEDKRNYIHYSRLTTDGRIIWGGGDAVAPYGSRVDPGLDRREGAYRRLEADFRWYFPHLPDLAFPDRWSGPVAVTADFLPIIGTLPGRPLHFAFGCNGHGVAPSHTWGQILRDLCLERTSRHTELLFVGRDLPPFPPEPLRWVGAEATRRSLHRQDRAMDRGAGAGDVDPLILRLLKKLG